MSKTVYSLVLTDQVVEEIDRLAYSMGKSRSALIDRILAEHVSYVTPEMRVNNILDSINEFIKSAGESFMVQSGDQSMVIRSSLKYKYKPSICYSLQLLRTGEHTEGKINIGFRTQSEELKQKMQSFLKVWTALENEYIAPYFPSGIRYTAEDGKLTRSFILPDEYRDKSTPEIGEAIAEYIRMFDTILKCFFAEEDNEAGAAKAAEKYLEYLENGIVII